MVCKEFTARKVSKYGVISGSYFPAFGPEITPYLDTFHAVGDLPRNNYLNRMLVECCSCIN